MFLYGTRAGWVINPDATMADWDSGTCLWSVCTSALTPDRVMEMWQELVEGGKYVDVPGTEWSLAELT